MPVLEEMAVVVNVDGMTKRHLGVLSHKHEPSIQNNLGIPILLYYTLYLWKELHI